MSNWRLSSGNPGCCYSCHPRPSGNRKSSDGFTCRTCHKPEAYQTKNSRAAAIAQCKTTVQQAPRVKTRNDTKAVKEENGTDGGRPPRETRTNEPSSHTDPT
ncbi:hypothetical protein PI125_g18686 [Phytophthora idaei]|nr:hypothetical protein PI125_g18686 [Phytophthora idaei]